MSQKTILSDSHIHSDFSADSFSPMEDMADKACRLGLSSICFTEHMDYDFPPEDGREFVFDIPKYLKRIAVLREKYNNLKIRQGIELGLKPMLAPRLNKLTSNYPFDFVIGSTHLVDEKDPYYISFWDGISEKQGICSYYEITHKNILSDTDFDVYGHIDYILRYTPAMRQLVKDNKDTEQYYDECILNTGEIISEILKKLIENGKGIEVNSSGLKYGLGYPHPHTWILKRYRELGGEIITIGSDAHSPDYIAYSFNDIYKILLDCGFSYYTIYEDRKPCFIKL